MVGETGNSQAHLEQNSSGFIYQSKQDSGSLMGSKVAHPQQITVQGNMFPTDKTKRPLALDPVASSAIIEPELQIMTVNRPQSSVGDFSSSDDGMENVSYCEEDEAKLNPEVPPPGFEELHA